MAKEKKKQAPEEDPGGAPEWMVTFSDCMTLLLTFFVLLLSYSSFDEAKLRDLSDSLGREEPIVQRANAMKLDPVVSSRSKDKTQPTLNESTTPDTTQVKKANVSPRKKPVNFRNLKVFTVASKKVFFGSGVQLTPTGKEILKAVYVLNRHKPARLVISEFSADGGDSLSIRRANAIVNYLINKGVDQNSLNISTSCLGGNVEGSRTVEITRLERSIYE